MVEIGGYEYWCKQKGRTGIKQEGELRGEKWEVRGECICMRKSRHKVMNKYESKYKDKQKAI